MSAADPGTVFVVLGAALSGASVLTNALRGWPADGGVRRLGRVALALVGPTTRPVRALVRRLREPATARCARVGHAPRWDGYRESCRRCDAFEALTWPDGPPSVETPRVRATRVWTTGDDPTLAPESIQSWPRRRLRIEVDDAALRELRDELVRHEPRRRGDLRGGSNRRPPGG